MVDVHEINFTNEIILLTNTDGSGNHIIFINQNLSDFEKKEALRDEISRILSKELLRS